jgi:hypothetical protein
LRDAHCAGIRRSAELRASECPFQAERAGDLGHLVGGEVRPGTLEYLRGRMSHPERITSRSPSSWRSTLTPRCIVDCEVETFIGPPASRAGG